jgi:CspA family cold shock protein
MTPRKMGKVVSFQDHKGYGFIKEEDGGGDIFFHWSYIQMEGFKTVKPGQRVSYEISENHQGPMAVAIKIEE